MAASKKTDDTAAVLSKIEAFRDEFRPTARRMHEIIMEAAPSLAPRLWYGMPGYAKSKSTPVLVYFRADKYMTFGMTESAHHSPEPSAPHKLMPTAWYFTELDEATEEKIKEIVLGAVE